MVDRVEVDPDRLATAAGISQELGDSILGVGRRLRERLDGLEDEQNRQPWGNDSFGEKFVNGSNNDGYGTSEPNLLDGVDGIGGTFVAIATGQNDAVDELRRMDGQI
ncbi:hypothetical protein [Nocardia testacea]|uniref:hypothetical protein n=1 Tax=Nocardia testacea TaxID=248551 RepID=UPI0033F11791